MTVRNRRREWARRTVLVAVMALAGAGLALPPAAEAAPTTVVSLTFNDGLLNQYTNAAPILKAHNMRGTFYVVSRWVDDKATGYMASWQLDNLYRDGNEIGGMSRDHIDLTQTYFSDPAADLAYKTDQVCSDRQRLAALGYDPQSFDYPFAAYNAAAESIVQSCGYLSGRTGGTLSSTGPQYAETIPPADPYAIRVLGMPDSGPITLQSLQDAVNNASAQGGGWLPLAFNRVCNQADPNYSTCMSGYQPIDDTVLSAFLDWLQTGAPAGTTVETVRDVMGAPAQPPLPPRPTVVSLTFDDGLDSQYRLRSTLTSHNDDATFYINSGAVDANEAGAMTWAQIHNLAADGNDIGGHTVTHEDITTGTFDFKWHQVCDDRARLVQQGFNPVSFAYPFAAFNATAESIVQACGYQSGRTGGTLSAAGPHYAETIPPAETYAIRILGTTYNGPITLQALQDAVNGAADHGGGWMPLLFHDICYHGDANFNNCMNGYRPVDDTTLNDFLDWLNASASRGISVKDVAEVMGSSVPSVTVTSPTSGQTVRSSPVTLSGAADPTGGDVTVSVYQGPYATGTPTTTLTATNNSGSWSVSPSLADGTYTIQAAQTSVGLTGYSVPRTFTVDTTGDVVPPAVAIASPANGSTVTSPTLTASGTAGTAAGDAIQVTLKVYAGTTPGGTALQTLTAPVATDGGWTVNVSSLANGTYTLQATQSDQAGNTGTSNPVTVTVATPVLRVTSVTPATVSQGALGKVLTVTGTGFSSGDTVSFSGTGITAGPTTFTNPTTLNVTVDVQNSAGKTARNVVVTRSGGTSATCIRCLTITSGPHPTSANPNTWRQGATATVAVSGSGFVAGDQVTFSGSGVSANVTAVTASKLTLSVNIASDATVGSRDITVTQPDGGQGTCQACFSVNAGPTVTSVSPSTLRRSTTVTVTITGTTLIKGAKVTVSGTGVTVGTTTWQSATSMTAVLRATATAPTGARSLTVTNPDGGVSTLANAFTVTT
jgi:peptidoglycan/xylan/chitin deacetylase (PgdA/CDA1 family)